MTKHEILTDGVAGEDRSEKKVYEAPILRVLDAEDTANDVAPAADGGTTSS
jgi:hypothetical protein